jgi:malate synthase
MGGMAAQIPIKNDETANAAAIAKVRADKRREAHDGHDGTWVAHPGLVEIARDELDRVLEGPNQLDNAREDVWVTAKDLLEVPEGHISEKGLRHNLNVGLLYVAAWLSGNGCVPLYHLMEDAATAEISRAQVWQWIRHGSRLDDGRTIDRELVTAMLREEADQVRETVGDTVFRSGRTHDAARILERMVTAAELDDFLTLIAYPHL